MRLIGGLMYFTGFVLMAVNLVQTALAGKAVDGETSVLILPKSTPEEATWSEVVFGKPVLVVTITAVIFATLAVVGDAASVMMATLGVAMAVGGTIGLQLTRQQGKPNWHRLLEGRAVIFTAFTVVAVLIGGVAEIVPSILTHHAVPATAGGQTPYRPLELEGRDIYVREGCYTCHSQMIRPFVVESQRYGAVSRLGDSQFDHPFQWGSKRTGPDLAREGGRNPNLWHYRHIMDPRSTSAGSIMPPYPSLATTPIDFENTADKLAAMQAVGVPYTDRQVNGARADARRQAAEIIRDLHEQGVTARPDSEIVALIAYLQRLGRSPGAGAMAGSNTAAPTAAQLASAH
jgi:cytochrome c oxidase cbb3-type subunit I/II